MLKIRLQRVGRKHDPVFRVVAVDSRRGSKSGKPAEILGVYNPRRRQETTLDADRVKYWLGAGAQVSGTVHNLLVDKKLVEGAKLNVLPKRKPKKAEAEKTEAEPGTAEAKPEAKVEEESTEKEEEKPEAEDLTKSEASV